MIPGGMSDLPIPPEDPIPDEADTTPVRQCDACGQSYVKSHLGDHGICRACEIAEQGIRNMIADEVRVILHDYEQAVLNRIRNIMR